MVMIKTLLYTGVRGSEWVHTKRADVDFTRFQIRINQGIGGKDRLVPFHASFTKTLLVQAPYAIHNDTERGVRNILQKYSDLARMEQSILPHKLRHFLFTWLKKHGIDDFLIQPYSGHSKRQSLEVYSKLAMTEAQEDYNHVIDDFPV